MKTKKIFATIIVLACVMALLAVPAFADSTITDLSKNQTVDVNGIFDEKGSTPTVYSVDIKWGAMEFTYTSTGTKTWNPEKHEYVVSEGTEGWTANGDTVTVINHSTAAVKVDIAFSKTGEYGSYTGSFDYASKTLAAGVEGKPGEADSLVGTLTLEGKLNHTVTTTTKLGEIKVTLTASN